MAEADNSIKQPAAVGTTERWSLKDLKLLLRFEYLPFAICLPLLEAAASSRPLTIGQISGLVGIATVYHIYTALLNDIVDLPLDRTEPGRADYPLVRGKIQPGQALVVALAQIPLAILLTLLIGGDLRAYAVLGVAFLAITIYNVWGKRLAFPIVTDIVQGIAFASVALYGSVIPGPLTLLGVIVFVSVVVWMVLTNLLGGLRDLHGDLNFGVRTTPIQFGARPHGQVIPGRVAVYAYSLQAIMIGLIGLALLYNEFGYGPIMWAVVAAVMVALSLIALRLLQKFFTLAHDYSKMIATGQLQMAASSGSFILLLAPYMDWKLLFTLGIVFLGAVLQYNPNPPLPNVHHP